MKRRFSGITLTLFIVSILCSEFNAGPIASSGTPEEQEFINRHFLNKNGTYFELSNSEYLNVTITSTATVHIVLSAPPKIVDYFIESVDGADSTTLTLGNLQPSTTYYMYEDSYVNEVVFTTYDDGSYTYTQDLSQRHHVFIQPRASTMFIYEDTTLTHDIYDSVQICADNIVLDLNGYSIIGSYTGYGVSCAGLKNVTIKNGTIEKFTYGVDIGSNNKVADNTIRNYFVGVHAWWSYNNTISGNNITKHYSSGISMLRVGTGNKIYDNTLSDNEVDGIFIAFSEGRNKIFHNNFINNLEEQAESWWPEAPDIWDDGYPSGGNYWSDYKGVDFYGGPYQNVTGSDGIGDTAYEIETMTPTPQHDRYPLMSPWIPPIAAIVDHDPDTLNLGCEGNYVTVYIELPEECSVGDIDVFTIMLNATVAVDSTAPTEIGDYDNDGIPDLMVKLSRAEVISYIIANLDISELGENPSLYITLTITGYLKDETPFQGSDTIRILIPKPWGLGRAMPL